MTPTVEAPPAAVMAVLEADNARQELGACVIPKVCVPTVMAAVRGAAAGLAATAKATVPAPVPLAPLVMVTQAALLAAVQEQKDCVETWKLPEPPALAKFAEPLDSEKEHTPGACVRVNTALPIWIRPVRSASVGLAGTDQETAPLPTPTAPAVTVIQLSLAVAVRGQSGALAATVMVPLEPLSPGTLAAPGEIVKLHGSDQAAPQAAASQAAVRSSKRMGRPFESYKEVA